MWSAGASAGGARAAMDVDLSHLTPAEKEAILSVIKRDEVLRRMEERRILHLKAELQRLRKRGALRPGLDPARSCGRCLVALGRIMNRGAPCPVCRKKVCRDCRLYEPGAQEGSQDWICIVCQKQMELKATSGQWMQDLCRRSSRRRKLSGPPVADLVGRALSPPPSQSPKASISNHAAATASCPESSTPRVQPSQSSGSPRRFHPDSPRSMTPQDSASSELPDDGPSTVPFSRTPPRQPSQPSTMFPSPNSQVGVRWAPVRAPLRKLPRQASLSSSSDSLSAESPVHGDQGSPADSARTDSSIPTDDKVPPVPFPRTKRHSRTSEKESPPPPEQAKPTQQHLPMPKLPVMVSLSAPASPAFKQRSRSALTVTYSSPPSVAEDEDSPCATKGVRKGTAPELGGLERASKNVVFRRITLKKTPDSDSNPGYGPVRNHTVINTTNHSYPYPVPPPIVFDNSSPPHADTNLHLTSQQQVFPTNFFPSPTNQWFHRPTVDSLGSSPPSPAIRRLSELRKSLRLRDVPRASDSDTPSRPTSQNSFDSRMWQLDDSDSDIQLGFKDKTLLPDDFKLVFISSDSSDDESDDRDHCRTTLRVRPRVAVEFGSVYFEDTDWEFTSDSDGGTRVASSEDTSSSEDLCSETEDVVVPPDELAFWRDCLRGGSGSSGDEETRSRTCGSNQRSSRENGPETSGAEHRPGVVGVGANKISELGDPEQRSFTRGESWCLDRVRIWEVEPSTEQPARCETSPPVSAVTEGTIVADDAITAVGRTHVGEPDRGGPCSPEAAIRFSLPPVVDSLPEVGEENGTDATGDSAAELRFLQDDAMVDRASPKLLHDSQVRPKDAFSQCDESARSAAEAMESGGGAAGDNDPCLPSKMAASRATGRGADREVGQQESSCAPAADSSGSCMDSGDDSGCLETGRHAGESPHSATKGAQLENRVDVSDRGEGSDQQVTACCASDANPDTVERGNFDQIGACSKGEPDAKKVDDGSGDSDDKVANKITVGTQSDREIDRSFDLEGMVVSTLERYFTETLEGGETSSARHNSLTVTWKRSSRTKGTDTAESAALDTGPQSSEASDASCDEDEEAMFSDASTSSDDALYISPMPKFNTMQYGNPLSYSLHTILEESCEESERGSRPTTPPTKNPSSELEKYFSFAIGNGSLEEIQKRWSLATSEEFSDTISETSGVDDVEVPEDDPAVLASSRLEKYFTSGLLGAGTFNYPDDAEFTDESGGVSSDDDDGPGNKPSRNAVNPHGEGSSGAFDDNRSYGTVRRRKPDEVDVTEVKVPLEDEGFSTIKRRKDDSVTEPASSYCDAEVSHVLQGHSDSLVENEGGMDSDDTLKLSEIDSTLTDDSSKLHPLAEKGESLETTALLSVATFVSSESSRDSQLSVMESSTSGIESMYGSATSLVMPSENIKNSYEPILDNYAGSGNKLECVHAGDEMRDEVRKDQKQHCEVSSTSIPSKKLDSPDALEGKSGTEDENLVGTQTPAEPSDDGEILHVHSRSSSTGGYSDEEAAYIVNRVIAHISGMNEENTSIDANVPPWKALLESQITRLMQTVSPAGLSSESSSTIGSNNSDYGSDTLESGGYASTDDETSPRLKRLIKPNKGPEKKDPVLEENEKQIADNVSGHSTDSTISEETIFICKQLMQSLKMLSDERGGVESKPSAVISDHNHNDYEKAQEYIQDQIVALMHTVSASCNGSPLRERRGKVQGSAECSDIDSPNLSEKKRALGKTKSPSESGSETVSSSISIPSYDSDHTATESEVSHEMDELYHLLESTTPFDNVSLSKLSCCDGEGSLDHFLLPPSKCFSDAEPSFASQEPKQLEFLEQNCDLPGHEDDEKLPGMFGMSTGSAGKCDSSSTLTAGSDLDFCGSMETVLEVGPKPEAISPEPSTSPTEPDGDKSRSEPSLYIKARKGLTQRRLIVTRSSDSISPYKRGELQLFRPSKSERSLPDSAVSDDKDDNASEASTNDDSLPSKRMTGKEKSSSENNLFVTDFPKVRRQQKVSGTKSVGNIADIDGSKGSCFRDTGYYSFKSSEESVLSLEESASRPASASLTRQKSVPSSETIPEVEEEPVRPARSVRPSSNCLSSSNIPESVFGDCKSSTLPSSLRSKVSRPSPHSSSMVLRQRHFSSTFFSTSGVLRKLTALKADDSSGSHRSSPRGRLRARGRHSSGGSDDSGRVIPVINVEESGQNIPLRSSTCAESPLEDRLDNAYPSCSKSQMSLSSIAPSRSESMTSVYSAAGRYGTVVVTGEAQFGLLYNPKTGMLEVHVKQCRNLAPVEIKKNRSDPYVKVYLLPDRTKSGKRKTKVKKNNLSPVFDEVLKFRVTMSELQARVLWLSVWHSDIFGRNDFLGEVMLQLSECLFRQFEPKWYPLQERRESMEMPLSYKGDLMLSLKYMPPDITTWRSKQGPARGSLHILVKEARNLMATRSNGTADPFCKSYLLPDRTKGGKQKTPVVKKTCNPKWNHTFVYRDVSLESLKDRCLELTLWDYDKYSSNDFLGGVRLGTGIGKALGSEVDWMDSQGDEVILWRTMLEQPNTWVEGKLQLRPNLTSKR